MTGGHPSRCQAYAMNPLDTEKDSPRLLEKNWFLFLNLALALVLGGLTLIIELSAEPPLEAFQKARKALGRARQNQANIYLPDLLIDAEYLLEQSKLAWQAENGRWLLNRNFFLARRYAQQCSTKAAYASQRSVAIRDSLRQVAESGIRSIKQHIETLRPDFQKMPLDSRLRQKFVAGELCILESEAAFKRKDYKKAVARYQMAANQVGRVGNEAAATLSSYFANAPTWRKWVQETILWSRDSNDVVVIVDKLDHECHLFSSGEKVHTFDIELGPNWLGHKLQRGDNATPEGKYRIKKMKANGQTKYFLAMEIDYPNEQDRTRFYLAKARGDIAHNASIGGLIEIHGEGGKGANWTAGCVALKNSDMEKVFKRCKVGTPITIVGTAKGAIQNLTGTTTAPKKTGNAE